MCGSKLKNNFLRRATSVTVTNTFIGISVVIAPHPDDESLACGGTIALLKKAGRKVFIIFVSDGSMSHPASVKYAAPLLMQVREKEALSAAAILGVEEAACFFMRLKDAALPHPEQEGFFEAVLQLNVIFKKIQPDHIFLPFKNDPHKDHQACWYIVQHAIPPASKIQLYHYLVWFWERGDTDDNTLQYLQWIKVKISAVLPLKKCAIAAHLSQISNLIDDDENGFTLSENVLNHFNGNEELFGILKK